MTGTDIGLHVADLYARTIYELAEQLVLHTLQLGDAGAGGVAATGHHLDMPLSVLPVTVGQRCLGDK